MDNFGSNQGYVDGVAAMDSNVSGQDAMYSQFSGFEDDNVADLQVSVDAVVDVDESLFTSEACNDDIVLAFDSLRCNSTHIVIGNSQTEDYFRAEDCFVNDVEVNDEDD
ncbi:hypothetical protein L6452_17859 [Arctium lappa]|uniref:Uncharacterized protein n=1 Tax=Arctium lappa TaxID=4217 RepID=A0ACB9C4M2_ARCLA|nr:hypothetical protein L6452_17859 [Arctium lappa]